MFDFSRTHRAADAAVSGHVTSVTAWPLMSSARPSPEEALMIGDAVFQIQVLYMLVQPGSSSLVGLDKGRSSSESCNRSRHVPPIPG